MAVLNKTLPSMTKRLLLATLLKSHPHLRKTVMVRGPLDPAKIFFVEIILSDWTSYKLGKVDCRLKMSLIFLVLWVILLCYISVDV